MKKIILTLALLSVLILPVAVLAQNVVPNPTGVQIGSIDSLISNILTKVWIVFVAFAVIMFLWAGIMFLTAQGNAEKIAQARQAFLWGVVGIIVGIISYTIVAIVGSLVGGGGNT